MSEDKAYFSPISYDEEESEELDEGDEENEGDEGDEGWDEEEIG